MDGLLALVERERNGESINRQLLSGLVRMLNELGLYTLSFQGRFLEASSSYYQAEGEEMLLQMDLPQYLLHCEVRAAALGREGRGGGFSPAHEGQGLVFGVCLVCFQIFHLNWSGLLWCWIKGLDGGEMRAWEAEGDAWEMCSTSVVALCQVCDVFWLAQALPCRFQELSYVLLVFIAYFPCISYRYPMFGVAGELFAVLPSHTLRSASPESMLHLDALQDMQPFMCGTLLFFQWIQPGHNNHR